MFTIVNGTVKWFNSRKGYGFITSEEGGDVFVHYAALARDDDQYKTLNETRHGKSEIIHKVIQRIKPVKSRFKHEGYPQGKSETANEKHGFFMRPSEFVFQRFDGSLHKGKG